MSVVLDPEFWARWLGIVVIDLTLASDNALVIALAVRHLPPRPAKTTSRLRVPFLQLVAGLLLAWIAIKLLRQPMGGHGLRAREGASLTDAVWIIVVADAVMSLDNVLAVAAAARGNLLLVVFGIALSLPLVVWGSGLLAGLMHRFTWIVWVGGGILGYVAAEMIVEDPTLKRWLGEAVEALSVLPALLGVVMTALGWWFATQNGRKKIEV
ncbi:MAG: hypothetical protein DMD91_15950 [Candidatus Rokuibacteriota bacterium]|nr:MAG: hypothetical protein DMD91_15950 [Candidatus Rokubacteria bacterium]